MGAGDDPTPKPPTRLSERTELDIATLFTPGLHPRPKGRALWAQILVRGGWHPSAHLHQHLAAHGHLDRLFALQQRGFYEAATEAEIPDTAGGRPFAIYNLVCAHALPGQVEPGLELLAAAVPLDPNRAAAALTDSDLERLRKHARFAELVPIVNGRLARLRDLQRQQTSLIRIPTRW